jgi:hypothetical protein
MARCVECWYAKRSTVSTYEPMWTCLHPMSIQTGFVGYPKTCGAMREKESPCGPEGALFRPQYMDGPEPAVRFRQ